MQEVTVVKKCPLVVSKKESELLQENARIWARAYNFFIETCDHYYNFRKASALEFTNTELVTLLIREVKKRPEHFKGVLDLEPSILEDTAKWCLWVYSQYLEKSSANSRTRNCKRFLSRDARINFKLSNGVVVLNNVMRCDLGHFKLENNGYIPDNNYESDVFLKYDGARWFLALTVVEKVPTYKMTHKPIVLSVNSKGNLRLNGAPVRNLYEFPSVQRKCSELKHSLKERKKVKMEMQELSNGGKGSKKYRDLTLRFNSLQRKIDSVRSRIEIERTIFRNTLVNDIINLRPSKVYYVKSSNFMGKSGEKAKEKGILAILKTLERRLDLLGVKFEIIPRGINVSFLIFSNTDGAEVAEKLNKRYDKIIEEQKEKLKNFN